MKLKRLGLPRPENRLLLSTNSIWDLITGKIVTGAKGESIIVGGASDFNAYVGPGNSFKSAILYFTMGAAANYVAATSPVYMMVNDTECNTDTDRLDHLMRRFKYLNQGGVCDIDDGELELTSKALISGDMWWKSIREYSDEHVKSGKVTYTAFKSKDGSPYKALPVIMTAVDSFSKLGAQITDDMLSKAKGEDGSTNTVFMKDGLFKTKLLGELPTVSSKSNMYFFTTAHTGRVIEMGNIYNRPPKKLSSMKDTMDIKKVSSEFFYLTKILTNTVGVRKLTNADGAPEFPTKIGSNMSSDLKLVKIETLRNKHGASEAVLEWVVSQKDGVLPELTDYWMAKSNGFGLSGSPQATYFEICPDIKFNRKQIRDALESSSKLARAARLTADLFLLKIYHTVYESLGILRTPKELYNGMIELGYDWDEILSTRGWSTPDQYNKDLPHYMSIVDLLKYNAGSTIPYWHNKKKKTKE